MKEFKTKCHQCGFTKNKVSIVPGGYIVKCKCGNKGLEVKKTIASAVGSWCSGHQDFDKNAPVAQPVVASS